MPEAPALLYIGAMILFGLLFGRFVNLIRLPNVTGYLLVGLIMGPHVVGFFPQYIIDDFAIVSEMALAFIAFTIGCEFKRSFIQKVGITPVVITTFESLGAVLLVDTVLILTGHNAPFSIVLGAIAAATAPAATIMVIKQYHARGPVTDTLMSVVALDDAVALIAFAISVAVAKSLGSEAEVNILISILTPIVEIVLSILLGLALGVILHLLMKLFNKQASRLLATVSAVFIASSISTGFGLSPLITCMMCGMVFCNIGDDSDEIVNLLDNSTPPIYVMFFVVSGACLNINLIPSIGAIGLIYVFTRVAGKLVGASIGAKIMKADKNITRYLGPALIPQAGVAIGLTIIAQDVVPEYAEQIRAIILCSTMIYELFGPVITKTTLKAAGELHSSN